MPLYEYECESCGHRFERIQKFSDPLVETCPKCGGKVHKMISSPAIQFKGSGWYITEYSKKGSSDSGNRESGESGKATSDSSTTEKPSPSTSDAKPASSESSSSAGGDSKSSDAKPSDKKS
jgi:putative FmdB family regulatory protein